MFPTAYPEILALLDQVDPVQYGRSRNFTSGAVTRLSPYISRGVISTRLILQHLLRRGASLPAMNKLVQELAWREYFQRAWQHLGDDLFNDIRRHHTGVQHNRLPRAVEQAATGIQAVDAAIRGLYETGYMHNHLRMYVASITCNVAKAYWQLPSRWMYYHLLDGDLASNTGNWQWVAGTFNGRTYYCNQDNINRFTLSAQQGTFLDRSYEELRSAPIPAPLQDTLVPPLTSRLPQTGSLSLDPSLPLLLYNSYNLDPRWRAGQPANRVLLLEPSHFRQFPVSERVIRFLLDLAANVEGLQVFTGEVQEIPGLAQFPAIYSREHPAFTHYPGIRDPRDWIFPSVQGFYSSFFAYWKKCESLLAKKEVRSAVAEQA